MKRSVGATSLLYLLLMLVAARCKEPKPVITPCFTIVEDSFRDPREPMQFVNCSEGASAYHWDFGDGQTSTEENPSHTFASTGYFDVRLAAQEGDWQEVMVKQVRVDYPRFKGVRVLQMPVISPRTGKPYDQGAPGLDLAFGIQRVGENFSATGFSALGVGIPHEFPLPNQIRINGNWGIFFSCFDSGMNDTILFFGLDLQDLIGSPVKPIVGDSLLVEIQMEGIQ